MPANFPTQFQNTLAAFTGVQRGATTFASRLIDLMNAAFGPSNPFGTAATRDTGTAEGNIPLLDSAGALDSAVLPAASADAPGAVTLARDLSDDRAGVVALPSQVSAAVAGLTQGFRADALAITQLSLNVVFTTPGSGFLIGSSGGQGGRSTSVFGGRVTHGGGGGAEALTIQYGAASASGFSASSPALTAGTDQYASAFAILPIDMAAAAANRAPKFAFVRGGVGVPGGRDGYVQTAINSGRADAGNLLIAFVEGAGKHLRMTADGTGGPGGRAGTPTSTQANGEAGANGFAVFVRVD